jgi:hypothetical protein
MSQEVRRQMHYAIIHYHNMDYEEEEEDEDDTEYLDGFEHYHMLTEESPYIEFYPIRTQIVSID